MQLLRVVLLKAMLRYAAIPVKVRKRMTERAALSQQTVLPVATSELPVNDDVCYQELVKIGAPDLIVIELPISSRTPTEGDAAIQAESS